MKKTGAKKKDGARLRVTLVKSPIGYDQRQRTVLRGLGLRRLRQSVELLDHPAVRGMVEKVKHLVVLETGRS